MRDCLQVDVHVVRQLSLSSAAVVAPAGDELKTRLQNAENILVAALIGMLRHHLIIPHVRS